MAQSHLIFSNITETELSSSPSSNVQDVLDNEIKEWHFRKYHVESVGQRSRYLRDFDLDIYFLQKNREQHRAALALRDAVLRLRRDGAFVAVPLFRVNTEPIGPHPAGSYEIWCPSESFASVFSYLCMSRGELRDHQFRNAWIGPSFPLDLSTLPLRSEDIPLQYPSLGLGYSSKASQPSLEERKTSGKKVEETLQKHEPEAAPAPLD
ncbi:hypothetical protein A7U60_g1668 [Sanghuangporus baumii]|uniref:Uncharacterized protein n=1 Tax=Sanghuangporus baumii TaxID=108892 RepID=A0A9Q5I3M2_SANBA|nr:hypothetical protein A7U60_g1668 [Sanghuangporus baumii]